MNRILALLKSPSTRRNTIFVWGSWVVATSLGWGIAGFSGFPIGRSVVVEGSFAVILPVALNLILLGGLTGALIGLFQWSYLRRRVPRARWWVPATALGWAVGVPAVLFINMAARLGLSAVFTGVVIGLGMGAAQWLVLRKDEMPGAWWIGTTVVGLGAGFLISGLLESALLFSGVVAFDQVRWISLFSGAVGGVFAGLVNGAALVLWVDHRLKDIWWVFGGDA